MLRTAKVSEEVIEQFAVFDTDGYTKLTGQAGSCTATLWKDGVESAVSVTIAEIGTTGEYTAKFTPDAAALWVLEVEDSTHRVWRAEVEVRAADVGDIYTAMEVLSKIETGRWKLDKAAATLTFYDDDNVTPLYVFDLKDENGVASATSVYERVPQ